MLAHQTESMLQTAAARCLDECHPAALHSLGFGGLALALAGILKRCAVIVETVGSKMALQLASKVCLCTPSFHEENFPRGGDSVMRMLPPAPLEVAASAVAIAADSQ